MIDHVIAIRRQNRRTILLFELFWGIALPFVQSTTTLPGYLQSLGASGILIGLVPAVFAGGIAFIQPFSLYLIRPGPARLRKTLAAYRLGASCYLLMALSAFLLPADAVTLRLVSFFVCYLGYVFIAGAGDPHYFAMVVGSTTARDRGWFFGLRIVWFGLGGLLGAALATPLLRAVAAPHNFALSMAAGALFILSATVWFTRFCDDSKPDPGLRPSLGECLTDVWRLARLHPHFLLFLVAACLFVLSQGPFAFLALYIKGRLAAGDGILARLGALFAVCSMIFALLLGRAGDRFGHRSTFLFGIVCYALGVGWMMVATSLPGLFAAYFLASIFSPAWQVSAFNLGYECAGEVDAARVNAGIALVTAPLRIIGPVAAGAALDRWGYPTVFTVTVAVAVVSLLLALGLPHHRLAKEMAPD